MEFERKKNSQGRQLKILAATRKKMVERRDKVTFSQIDFKEAGWLSNESQSIGLAGRFLQKNEYALSAKSSRLKIFASTPLKKREGGNPTSDALNSEDYKQLHEGIIFTCAVLLFSF